MKFENQTKELPATIECNGKGAWEDTAGLKVKVLGITVTECDLTVTTDCHVLLYSDIGFEDGINELIGRLGLEGCSWSEQGMQMPNKGIFHFDLDVLVQIDYGPLKSDQS